MSSKFPQYSPLSPSQSLPNLISSLGDIEKGRSGLPQPSNRRGLRENEDTALLAKTLSVCSSSPSADAVQVNMNIKYLSPNQSKTPPVNANRLESLYAHMQTENTDAGGDAGGGNSSGTHNSYAMIKQEVEKDVHGSLFGATILAGEQEINGTFSRPRKNPLSDLDLPSHIQEFKQQYIHTSENRIKLPLLTQLSPRTRKKISLLPKSTIQEQEKVEEYCQIGLKKVPPKTTTLFNRQTSAVDFHQLQNPPPKAKIATNKVLFQQLGKVIQKQKNLQYLQNKDLLGKHPAPVMLSDQVKSLGKLDTKHGDNELLATDATKVSSELLLPYIIQQNICSFNKNILFILSPLSHCLTLAFFLCVSLYLFNIK